MVGVLASLAGRKVPRRHRDGFEQRQCPGERFGEFLSAMTASKPVYNDRLDEAYSDGAPSTQTLFCDLGSFVYADSAPVRRKSAGFRLGFPYLGGSWR